MANRLLDSHKHYCFHSARMNVHQHPDLYVCTNDKVEVVVDGKTKMKRCQAAIQPDMAKQAGLVDADGKVSCPTCGCATELKPGKKVAELHVKLCLDETIHYPQMRKAGMITEEQYQSWFATLTREEKLGYYKRVPDVHVVAQFTEDETALMDSDLTAFNKLMQDRVRERAETTLLHQVQHRHTTESSTVTL